MAVCVQNIISLAKMSFVRNHSLLSLLMHLCCSFAQTNLQEESVFDKLLGDGNNLITAADTHKKLLDTHKGRFEAMAG